MNIDFSLPLFYSMIKSISSASFTDSVGGCYKTTGAIFYIIILLVLMTEAFLLV